VVLDTSVVIAGISAFKSSFLPGSNPSADILREWLERGRFVWLVTPEILEEYKEVARRLSVRQGVAGRLVSLLREEAEEVIVRKTIELSPDPGDHCFCSCAEAGKAHFIVTLNLRDFPQAKLSAKVASPVQFLGVIRSRPQNRQH
jgi:predicted nucleic acid-binding protein